MTATQTPIHISERFFAKAARYFGDLRAALTEIFQNAYRASLPIIDAGDRPRVEVTIWDADLEVRDFGIGIDDVGAALSIAVSGWDPSVEEEQDPAGMGLCAALAYSERVIIKSQFGTLEVRGEEFFTSPEYRESLLDTIQPDTLDTGASITLIGVTTSESLASCLKGLVDRVVFHHTAMDVFTRCCSDEDPTPEWERCGSIRDKLTPVCVPGTEDPLTHQGYGIFVERQSSYYFHGVNRRSLRVLWHGQSIEVALRDPAMRRLVTLPHGEEVMTRPKMPVSAGVHCIVIDHGFAPVTPKLPDRNELILDEKTVDFLWGFIGPLFEDQIQKRYQEYVEFMEAGGTPTARTYDRLLGCYTNKLPQELEGALYRHFVKSAVFGLPIERCSGHGGVMEVLCDITTPRTVLTPFFVLRTSDHKLVALDAPGALYDSGAQLTFAQLRHGMKTSGTEDLHTPVGCREIPEGIAVSYEPKFGCEAVPREGVMVIDVPYSSTDVLKEMPYGRTRCETYLLTDGPIDVEVYHFAASDDPLYARLSEVSEGVATEHLDGILEGAEKVTKHRIPGVVIATEEAVTDPDELVWIGDRECLAEATYTIAGVISECEFDEEPEIRRQDIREDFAQIRRNLGGVAEIGDAMRKVLDQIGVPSYSIRIRRFLIEPDDEGRMWAEVEHQTRDGETASHRIRCDLN